MANYNTLKTDIQSVIRQNDNNEITGQILQQSLLSMVNSLGAGYQYMGVATPTTNPGTPDQKVFYIASQAGTYVNFNANSNPIIVNDGELAILKYDTAWNKDVTDIASKKELSDLDQRTKSISEQGIDEENAENIIITTNEGTVVVSVSEEGVKITGDLRINGKKVTTDIHTSDTTEEQEEIIIGESEEYPTMVIDKDVVKVRAITDLEGNPITPVLEHPIALTDVIYVAVGRQLCLYADAIVKSEDRGLQSPMNYRVVFNCDIGEVHERLYMVTPVNSDIGSHTLRVRLFDTTNTLVKDETYTIRVVASGLSTNKNILFIGSSTGSDTAKQLKSHFGSAGGVQPTFVGSVSFGDGYCEAYGGWRFLDFDSIGRPAYRCQVSGVNTIARGAVYTDGSHNFNVYETNIGEGGDGNISLGYVSGVSSIPSTLTKVSGVGDTTITIVSSSIEGNNKLWNLSTNQLDIANYRSVIGLTDKIDVVCIQLGVNDANYAIPVSVVKHNIIDLYNAFVADNPSCKVIVALVATNGNTISGVRTNGNASYDTIALVPYSWGYKKMLLEELQNNSSYPNLRIAPISAQIDRYYGYARGNYPTSKYVSEVAVEHTNYVHPNDVGYKQLAEGWISEIMANN